MKPSLLLVWALLLLAPTEASTEPHYAVIIPAFLRQSRWQKVCIHISELTEKMQLTVTLRTTSHNHTLVRKTVEAPVLFECAPFQVPAPDSPPEEVASVHVEGHGSTFNFEKAKKVLLQQTLTRGYIQTDRPKYKPGDTVRFRIINVDDSFVSVNEEVPLVELVDPENNRVGQWLNVKPKQGIVDLSFPLANETALGTYTIKGPSKSSQTFEVMEYVLPKYEVVMEAPSHISNSDMELSIKLCARYTYGRPVQGTIKLSLCYLTRSGTMPKSTCQEFSGETEQDGCHTLTVNMDKFDMMSSDSDESMLAMEVKFTEPETEFTTTNTSYIQVHKDTLHMEFIGVKSYFQEDMLFKGKMKVEHSPGVPMKNTTVYLVVGLEDDIDVLEEDIILPFVTDDSGMVHFSLDTSSWKNNMVSLTGKLNITPSDEKIPQMGVFSWIRPFYSESKSFLQIQAPAEMPLDCHQDHRFMGSYTIDRKELRDKAQHIDFFYLVIGRDGIALSGQKRIDIGSADSINGAFFLELPVNSDMAPKSTLIMYTIFEDGEVSADNVKFEVFPCFKNKAEVAFSEERVRPGSEVKVHVQATPGSLCSVRAVDKSVLLMSEPSGGISAEALYETTETIGLTPRGYPYRIEDFEPYPCQEEQSPQHIEGQETPSKTVYHEKSATRAKRSKMLGPWYQSQADVYSFFKENGLKILTNTKIKEPVSCVQYNVTKLRLPDDKTGDSAGPPAKDPPTKDKPEEKKKRARVRSYFPETWLYHLVAVGETGKTDVQVTAPDTITEWKADAFCMGDVGLGIAPSAGLTVFQPYFVDVHLPYSVVRGEEFPLKATVFNYLRECVQLKVSLKESQEFNLVSPEEADFTHCLCNGESNTFIWNILATNLGKVEFTVSTKAVRKQAGCDSPDTTMVNKWRSDTMVKSLLVKAEGVNDETIHNCMLCPSEGKPAEEEISLALPELAVEGSEKAFISVWGDIMGSALQNIGQLLQMPLGCGEQNMVVFAPNVYIMQYLKSSGQLTPELEKKAVAFMTSGYQRQLMFKHDDGSYSAFGKSDEVGNTWLTVLVMKVFSQLKNYIFVEEKKIEESLKWMEKHQNPNGSFQSVGKIFNNQLKGALDDELSLTAYSTAALLEAGVPKDANMVKQALEYLRNANKSLDSTYNQALQLYVYRLAEEPTLWQNVLEKLMESAKREGGTLNWASDKPTTDWNIWSKVSPAAVEISAYVTLGLLSGKEVTKENMEKASKVVMWLGKQQNSLGGFVSTQLEKSPVVKKTELTFDNVIIFLEELTVESQNYTFSVEQETSVKNLKPSNVVVFDYYNPEDNAVMDYNSPCGTDRVQGQEL
ncbi:alpha-2-macroglobulin-like protein 1 [Lissotriton helveticus]